MNEQTPIQNPEPFDRRDARRQRREERLANRDFGGNWVAGLILILLGGMFLLRNMGTFEFPLKNWWALFILIPAIGSLNTALRAYREAGNRLIAAARTPLLVGTVLTFITIMFLFEISWTFFGPILIILVGVAILLGTSLDKQE